jgi:hypothetical protein
MKIAIQDPANAMLVTLPDGRTIGAENARRQGYTIAAVVPEPPASPKSLAARPAPADPVPVRRLTEGRAEKERSAREAEFQSVLNYLRDPDSSSIRSPAAEALAAAARVGAGRGSDLEQAQASHIMGFVRAVGFDPQPEGRAAEILEAAAKAQRPTDAPLPGKDTVANLIIAANRRRLGEIE